MLWPLAGAEHLWDKAMMGPSHPPMHTTPSAHTLRDVAYWSVHWWRHSSSDSPGCPNPPPIFSRTKPYPGKVRQGHRTTIVVRGTQVASITRPKLSDSNSMPSQLARWARASNGLERDVGHPQDRLAEVLPLDLIRVPLDLVIVMAVPGLANCSRMHA